MAGTDYPVLRQTVLDCADARVLAEFYRQLLGLRYRPGDEPPPAGEPDPAARDWLALRDPAGRPVLAFQADPRHAAPTWPDPAVPQQLHLEMTMPDRAGLDRQHERVLALGGRLLFDRSADAQEPLRVYADPAGHPFCMYVTPPVP